MTPWNKYETVAETTSKKWVRCQDCDKWKRTENVRVIDNLNLCKKCFKKSEQSVLEEL